MDLFTITLLVVFGVGALVGFIVGQWWSDIARAKHHMARVWDNRSDYRGDE